MSKMPWVTLLSGEGLSRTDKKGRLPIIHKVPPQVCGDGCSPVAAHAGVCLGGSDTVQPLRIRHELLRQARDGRVHAPPQLPVAVGVLAQLLHGALPCFRRSVPLRGRRGARLSGVGPGAAGEGLGCAAWSKAPWSASPEVEVPVDDDEDEAVDPSSTRARRISRTATKSSSVNKRARFFKRDT